MFRQINGKCRCCGEETGLSVIYDDSLICASCDENIGKSLARNQSAECSSCRKEKSLLALEGSESAGYVCWTCKPEGECSFCGLEKRLPFVGGNPNQGYFLFCRECGDKIKEVNENYEHVN
jgi:hypothetical protein